MRLLSALLPAIVLFLSVTGCGTGIAPSASSDIFTVRTAGSVHGGQQPVAGAQVYLYAVSNANGGTATSLLNAPGFVLSDLGGNFSISGLYPCPAGAYVYLLAVGGNPGLGFGVNNKIALAAGLGPCSALSSTSVVSINEVTTVAFASAISGYATSSTQIGTTAGVAAAFAYVATLVDPSTGIARASHDGLTLPQQQLNTLANAIAACVNSDGTGTPCSTLMAAANASPANTYQAALNIAKTPAANVSTIFNLSSASAPFQPTLPTAPGNWSLTATSTSGQIVADANTYAFATPLGTVCVEMRPDVAPLTVANFRYYVNNGSYANNMFLHRSVTNLVIQGGGYTNDNSNTFVIPTTMPVMNEFNLSNTRGTIAMAKVNNDPNSATSQFFFNVQDNSANLDTQNGGFTVFGRIVGVAGYSSGGCVSMTAGLAVMDAINALPTINAGNPFDSLPVRNYTSGALSTNNLVITTVAPANPL